MSKFWSVLNLLSVLLKIFQLLYFLLLLLILTFSLIFLYYENHKIY